MNIKIQHGSVLRDPITVGGYKFFYSQGNIQCATCLALMGHHPDPDIPKELGKVRELVVVKDCECPKQDEF